MLQHKTWMFSVRLKGTLFMGEKIPLQFLRLLPYKLYFFAIHQTPCSLCIRRLLIYSVRNRHALNSRRNGMKHSLSVTYPETLCRCFMQPCALSTSEICSRKQLVSAHGRHCLDAEPARDTYHPHDAVTLNATTTVLEVGKRYLQLLHHNGAFSAHWDCSGHFQLIFFLLHSCLSTRRKLLELLLPKSNE